MPVPIIKSHLVRPLFFKDNAGKPTLLLGKKKKVVNVGGNGDCGFRAIAACLLDNLQDNPRAHEIIIRRLLAALPAPKHAERLLTPADKLSALIKEHGISSVIPAMAYILRQIAVDEMEQHPESYRGAFADLTENTAPIVMRKISTYMDETSIAALANALDIPIKVHVVAPNKELPLTLTYQREAKKINQPELVIQLKRQHYQPKVNHPEYFKTMPLEHSTVPLKLTVVVKPSSESFETLCIKIRAEDARLAASFEETEQRLISMVLAGELDKDALLALYVKGLPHSDYLQGRVKYVTQLHGNQSFFEQLSAAQSGLKASEVSPKAYDELVVYELIHAISRAISIGHMSENVLDEIGYAPNSKL